VAHWFADPSPGAVVRTAFGVATIASTLLGVVVDGRFFAVSSVCGAVWLLWDVLAEYVVRPLGEWAGGMLGGSGLLDPAPPLDGEDVIRLLERNLEGEAPREVQIQSALRLAEFYTFRRHDPERSRALIARMREKFPDAPELERFTTD